MLIAADAIHADSLTNALTPAIIVLIYLPVFDDDIAQRVRRTAGMLLSFSVNRF